MKSVSRNQSLSMIYTAGKATYHQQIHYMNTPDEKHQSGLQQNRSRQIPQEQRHPSM